MPEVEKSRELKVSVGVRIRFSFVHRLRSSQIHVERIRADYRADLRNKVTRLRMWATAMYFVDVSALQDGNEKGEDEVNTVGCCSLRCGTAKRCHCRFPC